MSLKNHLQSIDKLRNRYVAVRHGESEANVAGLISSDPVRGSQIHGLSANGRVQVSTNSRSFLEKIASKSEVLVFSSDFRRAQETAQILARQIDEKLDIRLDQRLRERFFGVFDGKSDENYSTIWSNDRENPNFNVENQIEPVENVLERTTSLIVELEQKFDDRTIFLVSHGDALQILETAFRRMSNPNEQRNLVHLERAEFRPLVLEEKKSIDSILEKRNF